MSNKGLVVCRRLKGLLVENEITVEGMAKKIGVSENSLNLKINGHRDWWYWEVAYITKALGFNEIKDVFPELHSTVQKSIQKGA